jgi:hypothetical protein
MHAWMVKLSSSSLALFSVWLACFCSPCCGVRNSVKSERRPLEIDGGVSPAYASRRAKAMGAFSIWLQLQCQLSIQQIQSSGPLVAYSLRGFGLYLWDNNQPLYIFVDAINAVTNLLPLWRQYMTPAWQIVKRWQQEEPGSCRMVLPPALMMAAVSLGLLWQWPIWTALALLGFTGMLHPCEFVYALRKHLVLPRDALSSQQVAYLHIPSPKTKRLARRQHSRISDEFVVRLLDSVFGDYPMESRLCPFTASAFRSRWDAIFRHLGVSTRSVDRGITPGSLRGSGATYFYIETEDVQRIAWRGRWARLQTLEFYLQEVAAQMLLSTLSETSRTLIKLLADAASALLHHFIIHGVVGSRRGTYSKQANKH